MLRFISATFQRLIDEVSVSKTRYLCPSFQLRNRLTGLIGARGVGKTTLMLQYIKKELFFIPNRLTTELAKPFLKSAEKIRPGSS